MDGKPERGGQSKIRKNIPYRLLIISIAVLKIEELAALMANSRIDMQTFQKIKFKTPCTVTSDLTSTQNYLCEKARNMEILSNEPPMSPPV